MFELYRYMSSQCGTGANICRIVETEFLLYRIRIVLMLAISSDITRLSSPERVAQLRVQPERIVLVSLATAGISRAISEMKLFLTELNKKCELFRKVIQRWRPH